MNDPEYYFSIDQSPKKLADRIMTMAEGSTAEIVGDQAVFVEKFEPYSYSLAHKSGLVDIEITCPAGIKNVEPIKKAILTIADERGVSQIDTFPKGMKVIHLYFYRKEIA